MTNFDWMNQTIYEPSAHTTIEPAIPTPIPLGWRIFLVCAVLFIIGCGLAGLSY